MHGIIFKGLKDFVVDRYDDATWDRICNEAGVDGRRYTPVSSYPDEELVALVEAAVTVSGVEQSALLRSFGRYLVPTLVEMYGVFVDDAWTGLDLVVNVEAAIHRALRGGTTLEYEPPDISAERVDDDVVVVRYGSARGLCDVGIGLLEGIGEYYDEPLEVYERRCMHGSGAECVIVAVAGATTRRRANRLIDRRTDVA